MTRWDYDRARRFSSVFTYVERIDAWTIFLLPYLVLTVRFALLPFYYVDRTEGFYWSACGLIVMGFLISLGFIEQVPRWYADEPNRQPLDSHLSPLGAPPPLVLFGMPPSRRLRLHSCRTLTAIALGVIFALACRASEYAMGSAHVLTFVFFHLASANLTWASVQMLPALPLDGGRLILQMMTKGGRPSRRAINRMFYVGTGVAIVLMIFGIFESFLARPFVGAWLVLVGGMILIENERERRKLT